ncbi:MAG: DUF2497 domain-containing protein [Parvularculaceae bacterium]
MENAQPEPSMEEILASIRRIISEDEDEQKAPAPAAPKPELMLRPAAPRAPEPAPAPAPQPVASAPQQPEPARQTAAPVMEHDLEEEILDRTAADVASKAFRNLSQSVRVSEGPGRTLEDIVTEMLRPMVKDWLDQNLPAIVEEKVEEEVQRVARRRRG